MSKYLPSWFTRLRLRRYRRYLKKQIKLKNWDPELSAKLDAIHVLLED
jgi:hypothetical protein